MRRSSWSLARMLGDFGSKLTGKKQKGLHLPKRTFSIEPLEERALLSVCTWDGGGGNNLWSNAANWSNDTLPMPTTIWCSPAQASPRTTIAPTSPLTIPSIFPPAAAVLR